MGSTVVGVDDVYARLADVGLDYGPVFQGLTSAWRRGDEVFCEVRLPDDHVAHAGSFDLHPALFDAALHAAVLIDEVSRDGDPAERGVQLPFSWGEVCLGGVGASSLRVSLSYGR
jgi:acyl transferase domain-containing protein